MAPVVLICGAMASSAFASEADKADTVSPTRGAALFDGREALSGTIRGHTSPMPAAVLACRGCHARSASGPAAGSDAPSLDAADLSTRKVRRNGPPSAYGPDTFCRVLRAGVDPVYVTVSRTMPLFAVTPQQCESLWLYLTDRTSP